MQRSGLPSKQFLIRGGIATGIVAIVLIVQTDWFLALFNKKRTALDPNATVGSVIAKDSNGNGIPDWEERLWGLDPEELYTGDMSNKEIIETKKKALGLTQESDEPLTETDRLARQLFSIASSLGQEGVPLDALNSAGENVGSSITTVRVSNHYSYEDIRTVPSTAATLTAYHRQSLAIAERSLVDQTDLRDIGASIESGDYSQLSQLGTTAIHYRKIAQELNALTVPIGVAQYHLDIINGLYGMAESFTYIRQLDGNAVLGLNGLSIYKQYSMSFDSATDDLNAYLSEYGIL